MCPRLFNHFRRISIASSAHEQLSELTKRDRVRVQLGGSEHFEGPINVAVELVRLLRAEEWSPITASDVVARSRIRVETWSDPLSDVTHPLSRLRRSRIRLEN